MLGWLYKEMMEVGQGSKTDWKSQSTTPLNLDALWLNVSML